MDMRNMKAPLKKQGKYEEKFWGKVEALIH
jgi:hypothetical protein